MRTIAKNLIAGGLAAVAIGATAVAVTSAQADPPSGVTPAHTDIVGVGAQVDDLLFDQFSTDYNATITSTKPHLYSYDATGSATIPEKSGCAVNGTDPVRVNGANAGISALEANAHPTGDSKDFCVDFARDSRVRASTDPSSIVFVPFAVDAVTWAADSRPGHGTHAPANLTTIQLKAIYSCDAGILGNGGSGPVTWNEVGGKGTNQVAPVIPNSLSGTRSFFLSAIGVTTLGSCVEGLDNSVEQNEGNQPVFTAANSADTVFPYSVAVYLSQTIHGHDVGGQGNEILRKVEGVNPTVGTGDAKKININFPDVRNIFNVVRNASTTGGLAVPTYLQPVFGNGKRGTGWICSSATSKADIQSYGFLLYPSGCGVAQ